jgi:hypothetical protein
MQYKASSQAASRSSLVVGLPWKRSVFGVGEVMALIQLGECVPGGHRLARRNTIHSFEPLYSLLALESIDFLIPDVAIGRSRRGAKTV